MELVDGRRYWFDPEEVQAALFLYGYACLKEEQPEPSAVIQALREAKDRRAAFHKLNPATSSFPFQPLDLEALVERGELRHRSMVSGRDRREPAGDLSA